MGHYEAQIEAWDERNRHHSSKARAANRTQMNSGFAEHVKSKNRPHHDLIVAWAKGATIQRFNGPYVSPSGNYNLGDGWVDVAFPIWKNPKTKYRIKPQFDEVKVKAKIKELQEQLDLLKEQLNG